MEFLDLLITPIMLFGAWITGGILERRHMKNLLLLESGSSSILAVTIGIVLGINLLAWLTANVFSAVARRLRREAATAGVQHA